MSKELEKVATTTPNIDMTQNNQMSFANINQGSVAIESSRAIAEAQGKLIIAKRFPRNEMIAFEKMRNACRRKGLAEKAFYSYPRGGQTVKGPTIRLAEELANIWGNIEYGIKELSQSDGVSEMQAYAWDYENNTLTSQNFTNKHAKETTEWDDILKKKVPVNKPLTALRDIYENNANMGGRRLRARILALLPADFVEEAIEECNRTLAGDNSVPLIDRIKNMTNAFSKIGVTVEMIESHFGNSLKVMSIQDFTEYIGIYNSIKDGNTKISEWFNHNDRKSDVASELESELK